jgi:hypothetical protein
MHPQTMTEANSSTTIDMNKVAGDRLSCRDAEHRRPPSVVACPVILNVTLARHGATMSIIIVPMLMMAIPATVLPMVVVPVIIHLLHGN